MRIRMIGWASVAGVGVVVGAGVGAEVLLGLAVGVALGVRLGFGFRASLPVAACVGLVLAEALAVEHEAAG